MMVLLGKSTNMRYGDAPRIVITEIPPFEAISFITPPFHLGLSLRNDVDDGPVYSPVISQGLLFHRLFIARNLCFGDCHIWMSAEYVLCVFGSIRPWSITTEIV